MNIDKDYENILCENIFIVELRYSSLQPKYHDFWHGHHLKIEMQAVENSSTLKLLPKLIKSVFEYLMMQLSLVI